MLEELIDFGDAQVFGEATNYTCIFVADRSGAEQVELRKLPREGVELRDALIDPESLPAVALRREELGEGPWLLITPEEKAVLDALHAEAVPLEEVTSQIFQGLITSADQIYILEDRGMRGDKRRVFSRASGRELELEPDLLHPLASGADVERYAFRPLDSLLLFPYCRDEGSMRLLTPAELDGYPLTARYLRSHEQALRDRERGRMDHDGWYAFGRTQSLGNHDLPKLGVAATVAHLEVAIDPDGSVYFHNVRVNGILGAGDGPSIWSLLALLNSRPLDWAFRRGAAEHANGYYAANKQFIAPLPIRVPEGDEAERLDALGRRLHESASAQGAERRGFLTWLASEVGVRLDSLPGHTALHAYDQADPAELLAVLRRSRSRLARDPDSRKFIDAFQRERGSSMEKLTDTAAQLRAAERKADQARLRALPPHRGAAARHRRRVHTARLTHRTSRSGRYNRGFGTFDLRGGALSRTRA